MNKFIPTIVAFSLMGSPSGAPLGRNPDQKNYPEEWTFRNLLHIPEKVTKICWPRGIIPNQKWRTDYKRIPKNFSLMEQFNMTEKQTIDFALKYNFSFYFDPNKWNVIVKFPPDAYISMDPEGELLVRIFPWKKECKEPWNLFLI